MPLERGRESGLGPVAYGGADGRETGLALQQIHGMAHAEPQQITHGGLAHRLAKAGRKARARQAGLPREPFQCPGLSQPAVHRLEGPGDPRVAEAPEPAGLLCRLHLEPQRPDHQCACKSGLDEAGS